MKARILLLLGCTGVAFPFFSLVLAQSRHPTMAWQQPGKAGKEEEPSLSVPEQEHENTCIIPVLIHKKIMHRIQMCRRACQACSYVTVPLSLSGHIVHKPFHPCLLKHSQFFIIISDSGSFLVSGIIIASIDFHKSLVLGLLLTPERKLCFQRPQED